MALAESLWNQIDTYLLAAFTADMGAAAGLTTLTVQTFVNTAEWTPNAWTLPAVIVDGETGSLIQEVHFDGNAHAENTYDYVVGALCISDNYGTARANAKTLGHRLLGVVLDRPSFGDLGNADGSERVQEVHPTRLTVMAFPVDGNKNNWYGLATLEIDVLSLR